MKERKKINNWVIERLHDQILAGVNNIIKHKYTMKEKSNDNMQCMELAVSCNTSD
jgi:hypothetical protein